MVARVPGVFCEGNLQGACSSGQIGSKGLSSAMGKTRMSILMVSSGPPNTGGGTRIYCGNLSREMTRLGHKVFHFAPNGYDLTMLPRLRKRVLEAFEVVDVINSPVKAFDLLNPVGDIENAKLTKVFEGYLQDCSPDIVHFHDLLGLSSSLIRAAKNKGVTTVVTHSNYWFICPNTYLFNERRENCDGPQDGSPCVRCVSNTLRFYDRSAERAVSRRFRNTVKFFVERMFGQEALNSIRGLVRRASTDKGHDVSLESKGHGKKGNDCPVINPRGYHERFVTNIDVLNQYCDMNIAVSDEVQGVLINSGLSPSLIKVMPIGTRAAEAISPKRQSGGGHNLVFGYMGPIIYAKGLHVLIEAFEKLDQRKARLNIHGVGDPQYEYELRKISGNLNVKFSGQYKYENINDILSQIDVGVVPPLCRDCGPQVVFEFLAAKIPIIGSNIGGIPDFVQDGVNGLLFEPGDVEALVRLLKKLIENPALIKEMSGRIGKQKTMQEHAVEIEHLYHSLLGNA
jgi:glycosyltransferase involved in cell wall biosynthesis